MSFFKEKFPLLLFIAYVIVFIWLGIEPYAREVWFAENFPMVGIVVVLSILYIRGIRFSNISYALMSMLIFWNTVGGHYTFSLVPFDWFNDLFGFERNMYDRVGHFGVGFYAYAIMELLDRYVVIRVRPVAYLFSLFAIAFVALGYELVEWAVVIFYGGDTGIAFLGVQGDIWDAQKDMFLNIAGAVFVLTLYSFIPATHRSREGKLPGQAGLRPLTKL